jgi:aminoglycoside phosphotransferase (APT) family kinase protein
MVDPVPGTQDAAAVVQQVLHTNVAHIERFAQGLAHFVYDVRTADGQNLVVRLTRPAQRWMFEGALYWHQRLVPVGVPLPRLLHADLAETGGFPVMIMERLPGADLGVVYPSLPHAEKQRLAHQLVDIQQAVGSLPLGTGFGHATAYDDPYLKSTWTDVLSSSLQRSRERIAAGGVVDVEHVERVQDLVDAVAAQLAVVEPRCFLDDITTKNVIVHDGALSGIVDVDMVCFGDSLFNVALTHMALLAQGWDTTYIDAWCAVLELTAEQKRLLNLYTAVFCVDFLGEQGQQFNLAAPPEIDAGKVHHLTRLLDALVAAT